MRKGFQRLIQYRMVAVRSWAMTQVHSFIYLYLLLLNLTNGNHTLGLRVHGQVIGTRLN